MIMPPSALEALARLNIDYPMLFELTCESRKRKTHTSVMEFSAQEGRLYMPYWMMQNLLLQEGDFVRVKNVTLPKAKFVKFRPQSESFLEIRNPRAVLEFSLRNFSCVTVGDHMCINYNDQNYYMEVREVQPANAACIIETDCEVDFEPPPGYVEPSSTKPAGEAKAEVAKEFGGAPAPVAQEEVKAGFDWRKEQAAKYKAFGGGGQRLDGKNTPATTTKPAPASGVVPGGVGSSINRVARQPRSKKQPANAIKKHRYEAFKGSGQSLSGK